MVRSTSSWFRRGLLLTTTFKPQRLFLFMAFRPPKLLSQFLAVANRLQSQMFIVVISVVRSCCLADTTKLQHWPPSDLKAWSFWVYLVVSFTVSPEECSASMGPSGLFLPCALSCPQPFLDSLISRTWVFVSPCVFMSLLISTSNIFHTLSCHLPVLSPEFGLHLN